ncbi:hypothetical protein LTR53_009645, partial [Teratosphaeriaceae sp. CCFEE 6253]
QPQHQHQPPLHPPPQRRTSHTTSQPPPPAPAQPPTQFQGIVDEIMAYRASYLSRFGHSESETFKVHSDLFSRCTSHVSHHFHGTGEHDQVMGVGGPALLAEERLVLETLNEIFGRYESLKKTLVADAPTTQGQRMGAGEASGSSAGQTQAGPSRLTSAATATYPASGAPQAATPAHATRPPHTVPYYHTPTPPTTIGAPQLMRQYRTTTTPPALMRSPPGAAAGAGPFQPSPRGNSTDLSALGDLPYGASAPTAGHGFRTPGNNVPQPNTTLMAPSASVPSPFATAIPYGSAAPGASQINGLRDTPVSRPMHCVSPAAVAPPLGVPGAAPMEPAGVKRQRSADEDQVSEARVAKRKKDDDRGSMG